MAVHYLGWALIVALLTVFYHVYISLGGKQEFRKWFLIASIFFASLYTVIVNRLFSGTEAEVCLTCLGFIIMLLGWFSIFYLPYRLIISLTGGKKKTCSILFNFCLAAFIAIFTFNLFSNWTYFPDKCINLGNGSVLKSASEPLVDSREYWEAVFAKLCGEGKE